ncbi:MAG: DNA polymerase III subunit delta [Rikenellaceae bacterium]
MQFKDIIGQEKLKRELIDSVKQGRIAHSQLFIGETGYGVLPLTIAYAQYIGCHNRSDTDSCGKCSSCYKFSQLQHPDLHFIFPINKSPFANGVNSSGDLVSDNLIEKWREIVLESTPKGYFTPQQWYDTIAISKNSQPIIARSEANHLISKLSYKPFEGGYTTVIIFLAEQMNESAANTLLKLFEEPAENTTFLFIAQKKERMLKTILSRCQIINVKPIETSQLDSYISSKGVDSSKIHSICRISQGDINRVNTIIESLSTGEENIYFEKFKDLMRLCYTTNYHGLLPWAEQIAAMQKEEQRQFLIYSVKLIRDAYLINIGAIELSFSFKGEEEFLRKFAPYIHHQNIELLITEFERCNEHLSQNVNVKILFSHFTLAISKLIRLAKGGL